MQQSNVDCIAAPWPQPSLWERHLEDVIIYYGMVVTRRTAIAICSETERSWQKLEMVFRQSRIENLDPDDVLPLHEAWEGFNNPIRGETDFFHPGREV